MKTHCKVCSKKTNKDLCNGCGIRCGTCSVAGCGGPKKCTKDYIHNSYWGGY